MGLGSKSRAAVVRSRSLFGSALSPLRTNVDLFTSRRGRADLAVFHEFVPPPYGGGNQFLLALTGELRRRGLTIEVNRISGGTTVCLFNSFNFDFGRLRRFARRDPRMVHRVDGPVGVYRGFDDGTDRRIAEINEAVADATIFQSNYSLRRHHELGLELRRPVVIPNSVDPSIFHRPSERPALVGRRVRIVATSWSENPRKGADVLAWLDVNLDWTRYDMTFVGQRSIDFRNIRAAGPFPSAGVAEVLRSHDVYVAPSLDDPCSNAVLEALACGLPVVYRKSGGHPELVGEGGIGFEEPEELPEALERLVSDIDERRDAIQVAPLSEIADRYLEVLLR